MIPPATAPLSRYFEVNTVNALLGFVKVSKFLESVGNRVIHFNSSDDEDGLLATESFHFTLSEVDDDLTRGVEAVIGFHYQGRPPFTDPPLRSNRLRESITDATQHGRGTVLHKWRSRTILGVG